MKQNKKKLSDAVMKGRTVLFEFNPISFENDNDNIFPYDLETAGIDGYRQFYKVSKSVWLRIFNKIIR